MRQTPGYTDDWFKIPDIEVVSNTQLYKQLGNSVTIPLVGRLAQNVLEHPTKRQPATKFEPAHA